MTLPLILSAFVFAGGAAGLVHALIYLVVICLIVGLLWFILQQAPLPGPYRQWANSIFLIICAIFLIYFLLSLL